MRSPRAEPCSAGQRASFASREQHHSTPPGRILRAALHNAIAVLGRQRCIPLDRADYYIRDLRSSRPRDRATRATHGFSSRKWHIACSMHLHSQQGQINDQHDAD
jgi:hypothetical protein